MTLFALRAPTWPGVHGKDLTAMNKFFMIVGIIVVAWLALGLIGWLVGFLVKTVFWIAVVVGIVYIVATIFAKKRTGRP